MPFRSVSFPGVSRLLEPLTALPCCHRGLLLPQGRMVFRVCVCVCARLHAVTPSGHVVCFHVSATVNAAVSVGAQLSLSHGATASPWVDRAPVRTNSARDHH